ncbi:N-alpha-acetyltransferase 38, NatC auxiliary subunit-like [Pomacea canaliculata]|uniref:N-alpha-acetyltransferase 38, NatC auxiliary subunit-like n=1 Tax=Pomacea canaliculata TaxID=400727 RepID=UPI000D73739B|nr:N-alpha-acetyltransferase 38, NatC auxiliary subunit-like [Pomacea canaliculata]
MAGETQVSEVQVQPKSSGRQKLETWLNRSMKIKMSDGRTLIGVFLCTDRDGNVILGNCEEYIRGPESEDEEPRVLGLAMVPGHHILSIHVDQPAD